MSEDAAEHPRARGDAVYRAESRRDLSALIRLGTAGAGTGS